jgi:hypothetical protein
MRWNISPGRTLCLAAALAAGAAGADVRSFPTSALLSEVDGVYVFADALDFLAGTDQVADQVTTAWVTPTIATLAISDTDGRAALDTFPLFDEAGQVLSLVVDMRLQTLFDKGSKSRFEHKYSRPTLRLKYPIAVASQFEAHDLDPALGVEILAGSSPLRAAGTPELVRIRISRGGLEKLRCSFDALKRAREQGSPSAIRYNSVNILTGRLMLTYRVYDSDTLSDESPAKVDHERTPVDVLVGSIATTHLSQTQKAAIEQALKRLEGDVARWAPQTECQGRQLPAFAELNGGSVP